MVDAVNHGFTKEQVNWLDQRISFSISSATIPGSEISLLKWVIGGLFILGLTTAGFLFAAIKSVSAEIGSVREEIGSVRKEIGSVRENVSDLAQSVARIEGLLEALLEERRSTE